jgi:hypothetical protein
MSKDAFVAEVTLNPKDLFVVVEGPTDRRHLNHWSEQNKLPLFVYSVDDIEVIKNHSYDNYGSAKACVISLLESLSDSQFVDKTLLGLIDRDFDQLLRRNIDIKGIYYTDHSCFHSHLIDFDTLANVFKMHFGKEIDHEFFDEVESFALRYFGLLALKKLFFAQVKMPNIKKYVGKKLPFNWPKYIKSLKNVAHFSWNCDKTYNFISKLGAGRELKKHQHFHSTSEFIWLYARKCAILPNDVSSDEFVRALTRAFYDRLNDYPETVLLKTKIEALT